MDRGDPSREPALSLSLQRFLGYSERFAEATDDAIRAVLGRRHVLLLCPPGGQPDRLARAIHASSSRPRPFAVTPRIDPASDAQRSAIREVAKGTLLTSSKDLPPDPTPVFAAAADHDVRLVIVAPAADRIPFAVVGAALQAGAVVVRIPELMQRIEELPLLVSAIAEDVRRQLHTERVALDPFMPVLFSHSWPHNLEELEQVVAALVAREAFGSTRSAAAMLGIGRSTLSDRLTKLGLGTKRPRPRVGSFRDEDIAAGPLVGTSPVARQGSTDSADQTRGSSSPAARIASPSVTVEPLHLVESSDV